MPYTRHNLVSVVGVTVGRHYHAYDFLDANGFIYNKKLPAKSAGGKGFMEVHNDAYNIPSVPLNSGDYTTWRNGVESNTFGFTYNKRSLAKTSYSNIY